MFSQIRSRLVSNGNLYNVAVQTGLIGAVHARPFVPTLNWIPPGFTVNEKSDENIKLSYLQQEMSDKTVADSIEALIGAYLMVRKIEIIFSSHRQHSFKKKNTSSF